MPQICEVYMHLVKLTFWHNSKLQFVLINRTFYANIHHHKRYHDFRNNCLVLFKACISQCTGFNWEALCLLSWLVFVHSSSKVGVSSANELPLQSNSLSAVEGRAHPQTERCSVMVSSLIGEGIRGFCVWDTTVQLLPVAYIVYFHLVSYSFIHYILCMHAHCPVMTSFYQFSSCVLFVDLWFPGQWKETKNNVLRISA